MKKNTLFRIAAFTTALTIACGTSASCTKKNSSSGNNAVTQSAQESFANSYKAIPLDTPSEFPKGNGNVNSLQLIPNTENVLIGYYDYSTGSSDYYIASTDLSTVTKLDIDYKAPKNADIYAYSTVADNGNIYILANVSDYGDFERPDYEDPDFDWEKFDYEAMEDARTTTYKLICTDSEGKVISSTDVSGLEEFGDDVKNIYISGINAIGNDKMLLNIQGNDGQSDLALLSADGKVGNKADDLGLQWIEGTGVSADGKVGVTGYGEKGFELILLNPETLKPEGEKITLGNFNSTSGGLGKGSGDYIFFATEMSGYCGIKADGTYDQIVNFTDADLSQYNNFIVPVENGEFLCASMQESAFYRLVKRDASETANVNIVTIATLYDDYNVNNMIKDFNKSHDDIRFKAVNYGEFYEYDEASDKVLNSPSQQLKMDIISGKAPDMIITYDTSLIASFASKGVFTDLYSLMDNELSKDMIMENILAAGEYNGKLLSLSSAFTVSTYAAKEKYCDIENWTFSDLKETYEKLPDGMELMAGANKTEVFSMLVSTSQDFIDYTTAKCSFDTPEFKEILEFCNQFPKDTEAFDWENASQEEMQQYWADRETACANDKALISMTYFSQFRNYAATEQANFGGDKITLVGYPSENGNGAKINVNDTAAILESSKNKAACWEFVKQYMSNEELTSYNFSALKSEFEKQADEAMNKPYYVDENGEKHEYDDTYYIADKEVKIKPLTKEQKNYIVDYVKNAKSVSTWFSEDVNTIIYDELDAYFEGEKTADETAKNIQSKVSILISEQQ